MAHGDFKDVPRRIALDKALRDKAFNNAKYPKYDGHWGGLGFVVCNFFNKKSKGTAIKNEIKQNEQLAEELRKPITGKLKKRKKNPSFKDNIWGADLADIQ